MSKGPTTLITSLDPPRCSIFTENHGVLVLKGKGNNNGSSDDCILRPDVCSLAVLRQQPEAGSFHAVPLFPANQDPLSRTCQRIRGLQERLSRLLPVVQSSHQVRQADPPNILRFQQDCDTIFREFLSALELRKEAPKVADVGGPKLTSGHARRLIAELTDVQERFGASVIVELTANCQALTLQYQDAAERTHLLQLKELSNASSVSRGVALHFPVLVSDDSKLATSAIINTRKRPRDASPPFDVTDAQPNHLVQAYQSFCDSVDQHQSLYNELDDIDTNLLVLEPERPCPRNVSYRKVKVTIETSVLITLSVHQPRAPLQGMQWLGPDATSWEDRFDQAQWDTNKSVLDNLERCLGATLPRQEAVQTTDETCEVECAICYSAELDNEDDAPVPASATPEYADVPCDNESCGRLYHATCLREWVTSLADSRVSFDRILGTCPYCKQPLSVALQIR